MGAGRANNKNEPAADNSILVTGERPISLSEHGACVNSTRSIRGRKIMSSNKWKPVNLWPRGELAILHARPRGTNACKRFISNNETAYVN